MIEIVTVDSLLRQLNGFGDFDVLNFSMILLKFTIVLSFSCREVLQMGYSTSLRREKIVLNNFTSKSGSFSFKVCSIFQISVFYLICLTKLEN